ncbi:DNA repair protein complementing XP-C cells [Copidosoma floridanum]|uniref:DNA repair protein complementing XP-C cells n=1 Tax=Copidosoma floridanum TaxID=29053 RepID=UPI0006C9E322|nr:DNA repair protein complementing XP-C cells [Copidosoma floridanum]
MNMSDNDESSSSDSSNEFLVPADKLDLSSAFFQVQPKCTNTSNPKQKKRPLVSYFKSSYDSDSDFEDNQVSSAELLTQVLKNLEQSKSRHVQGTERELPTTVCSLSAPQAKNDLSKEIDDLLIMGESQLGSSNRNVKVKEVKQEQITPYWQIPEKGVQIHLPSESFMSNKKKKKQQDLPKMLQNKFNLKIRKTQMFIHKVGLLCWLAHGFHLNKLANNPDVLRVALSLVSSQNYPKGKLDLKYLENFTQWFGGLFKVCDEYKDIVFSKDSLLQRIVDKKIYNYVELILLYIAVVRGMGIHCRLVVSLGPPRLKPKQDELLKVSVGCENDTKKLKIAKPKDNIEIEDVTQKLSGQDFVKNIKKVESEIDLKPVKTIAKKTAKTSENKKQSNRRSVSPIKMVPKNSPEGLKVASEKARARAVALLQEHGATRLGNRKNVFESISFSYDAQSTSKTTPEKNSNMSDYKSIQFTSRKDSKTHNKNTNLNVQENSTEKDKGDENSDKISKQVGRKNRLCNKNTRVQKSVCNINLKGKLSCKDKNKNIEENDVTKATTGNFLIQSKQRACRNVRSKIVENTKDNSDNIENEEVKNEQNMPIVRTLGLEVNKKTKNVSALINKSSVSRKIKAVKKNETTCHSSNDEISDFEEELDSSELSDQEKFSSQEIYSTDSEFEETKPKRRKLSTVVQRKLSTPTNNKTLEKSIISKFAFESKNKRKLISSDDESSGSDKKGYNVWVEVYLESEESWISVSVLDQKIHCVSQLFKKASQPILYIIAWNSTGTLKDVTRRYCPHWLTDTRKKRIDEKWWKDTLSSWKEKNTAISSAEDEQLLQKELEQPLPKTVSECKGHPLYVLQRHLLKFEALYPPDVVPLGHLRTGEAIYSRHCVHTLYSRETWVRKARVVKSAQDAYKIVKSMPKYDKLSGQKIKDQPLELFGKWQTTPYEPSEAKDGKVPRNEYGNVDLFKICMLPKGCVYIDLPALNRVARKLNIDCAPACIGFNFGCRGALPAFQGFVVCQEYEDTIREAWEEEQVLAQMRAREKREKKIYGNWKKLIKGLLIREKLDTKYRFRDEEENAEEDEEEQKKMFAKGKKNIALLASANNTKKTDPSRQKFSNQKKKRNE